MRFINGFVSAVMIIIIIMMCGSYGVGGLRKNFCCLFNYGLVIIVFGSNEGFIFGVRLKIFGVFKMFWF